MDCAITKMSNSPLVVDSSRQGDATVTKRFQKYFPSVSFWGGVSCPPESAGSPQCKVNEISFLHH